MKKMVENYLANLIMKRIGDRTGKVYGFGHAVYTISDPRSAILKRYAKQLAQQQGKMADYKLYTTIEKLVPGLFADIKKSNKQLCSNVDFYSGFVYDCLDIPREVFTPLFAMARISGWVAHRIEEVLVSKRIIRPAYKNVSQLQKYILLNDRK